MNGSCVVTQFGTQSPADHDGYMTATVSRDEPTARKEGRRAAHLIVIAVAVLFVGASAAQIIPAVFGVGIQPIRSTSERSPDRACAEGIHLLAVGLDHANEEAWRGLTEWTRASGNVEPTCAKSGEGLDAWAALLRLRRAEEAVVVRAGAELAPLRHDVEAHLPADLRSGQEPAQ